MKKTSRIAPFVFIILLFQVAYLIFYRNGSPSPPSNTADRLNALPITSTATKRPIFTATPTSFIETRSVKVQSPSLPSSTITDTETLTTTSSLTTIDTLKIPRDPLIFSGTVIADLVNLRAGSGTSFDRISRVREGQNLQVLGRNGLGTWWQVRDLDNHEASAWIAAEFVDVGLDRQTALEKIPIVSTTSTEPSVIALGRVNVEFVNLRSGPSTANERIGRVQEDTVIEIVEGDPDLTWWRIVSPEDNTGLVWISAQFIDVEALIEIVDLNDSFTSTLNPVSASDLNALKIAKPTETIAETTLNQSPDETAQQVIEGPENNAPASTPFIAAAAPELPANGSFGPPGDINPLTGLTLPAERRSQRPIVTCINNDFAARPQLGISQADVMYEYLMEGYSITRFAGVFYSQNVPQIGPLRSARLINYYLGGLYNAPLFCSGASDQVRFILKNQAPFPYLDIDLDDGSNTRYSDSIGSDYRTRLRTNTAYQRKWLADWGAEEAAQIRGFTFGGHPDGGQSATSITIPYPRSSRVGYTYNAQTGQYLRFLGDVPHTDGNTGKQVTFANVVVQFVAHQATDIVEDSLGSTSIRLNLFGNGTAIVFREGQAYLGTWQSDVRGDLPRFYHETGAEIPLKPGQTWISIVPPSYGISYE